MALTDSKYLWISEVTHLFLWRNYLEKPLLVSPRVLASRECKMVQAIQDFCHPRNPGLPVPTSVLHMGWGPFELPLVHGCVDSLRPQHSSAPRDTGETQGLLSTGVSFQIIYFTRSKTSLAHFSRRIRRILIQDTIFVAPTAEEMGKEFFSYSASERKGAVNSHSWSTFQIYLKHCYLNCLNSNSNICSKEIVTCNFSLQTFSNNYIEVFWFFYFFFIM